MRKSKECLPVDLLRKMVAYDPEAGLLTWKSRTPDMFVPTANTSAESYCAAWNSKYVGLPAVNAINGAGYRGGCVTLRGRRIQLLAHRVVIALETGEWPTADIDHINGVRSDNRLCNLRQVSRSENLQNSRRTSKNTSGQMGVRWHTAGGKWTADICCQGHRRYLGSFARIEDAIAARKKAEAELGFHENHGRN